MKNQTGKCWLGWCVRPKMLDWLVEAVELLQTVFVVFNTLMLMTRLEYWEYKPRPVLQCSLFHSIERE